MPVERPVPYDLEAESALLGSLILERDIIIKIAPILQSDDFYREQHALIYSAILHLYERREPPDPVLLASELDRLGQLQTVGGISYIVKLANDVPTAVHAEYYARKIERCSLLRRVISAGGAIAALGYGDDEEASEVLSKAQSLLLRIAERSSKNGYNTLEQAANRFADRLDFLVDNPQIRNGVPTGFYDLDDNTGGLQKSDLIIIAGRPGSGKSSLGVQIAVNAAKHMRPDGGPYRAGIFSLEMSEEQLVMRMVAGETGIDSQSLRLGRSLSDNDLSLIMQSIGKLSSMPILLADEGNIDINQIRASAVRMKSEQDIDLLVVDYGQLIHGPQAKSREQNRVQEQSEVSRGLKLLARELNIPVIALCQLSRRIEERAGHEPMLSDLRDSGSWEQDADVIIFIHRADLYDTSIEKGTVKLLIRKHRNGPLGDISLRFDAATTQFRDLDTVHIWDGSSSQESKVASAWDRMDEPADIAF